MGQVRNVVWRLENAEACLLSVRRSFRAIRAQPRGVQRPLEAVEVPAAHGHPRDCTGTQTWPDDLQAQEKVDPVRIIQLSPSASARAPQSGRDRLLVAATLEILKTDQRLKHCRASSACRRRLTEHTAFVLYRPYASVRCAAPARGRRRSRDHEALEIAQKPRCCRTACGERG